MMATMVFSRSLGWTYMLLRQLGRRLHSPGLLSGSSYVTCTFLNGHSSGFTGEIPSSKLYSSGEIKFSDLSVGSIRFYNSHRGYYFELVTNAVGCCLTSEI